MSIQQKIEAIRARIEAAHAEYAHDQTRSPFEASDAYRAAIQAIEAIVEEAE